MPVSTPVQALMPVSTAVQALAGDRVEPVDLIHGLDLLEDDTFESLLRLASSGRIGAALAAPYTAANIAEPR